jgi:hypothetical protein
VRNTLAVDIRTPPARLVARSVLRRGSAGYSRARSIPYWVFCGTVVAWFPSVLVLLGGSENPPVGQFVVAAVLGVVSMAALAWFRLPDFGWPYNPLGYLLLRSTASGLVPDVSAVRDAVVGEWRQRLSDDAALPALACWQAYGRHAWGIVALWAGAVLLPFVFWSIPIGGAGLVIGVLGFAVFARGRRVAGQRDVIARAAIAASLGCGVPASLPPFPIADYRLWLDALGVHP